MRTVKDFGRTKCHDEKKKKKKEIEFKIFYPTRLLQTRDGAGSQRACHFPIQALGFLSASLRTRQQSVGWTRSQAG